MFEFMNNGSVGEEALVRVACTGGDPALDARARAEYKQRLADLRQQLEEAESNQDIGRMEPLRAELEFISEHLANSVGLGRRDRLAANGAERARGAIRKRIRNAIDRIRNGDPELGDHLARSIKTGLYCVYAPTPDAAPQWAL